MTTREVVCGIMAHIREATKGLDEQARAEVLECVWFEIEDWRSRLNWNENC